MNKKALLIAFLILTGCSKNDTALRELEIAQKDCATHSGKFTFTKKWSHGDWGYPYYEWKCS